MTQTTPPETLMTFDAAGICTACTVRPLDTQTRFNGWITSWAAWCVGKNAATIFYGLEGETAAARTRKPPKGEERSYAFDFSMASGRLIELQGTAQVMMESLRRVA